MFFGSLYGFVFGEIGLTSSTVLIIWGPLLLRLAGGTGGILLDMVRTSFEMFDDNHNLVASGTTSPDS